MEDVVDRRRSSRLVPVQTAGAEPVDGFTFNCRHHNNAWRAADSRKDSVSEWSLLVARDGDYELAVKADPAKPGAVLQFKADGAIVAATLSALDAPTVASPERVRRDDSQSRRWADDVRRHPAPEAGNSRAAAEGEPLADGGVGLKTVVLRRK
ncbi:MAG: hypothetical protein ACRC1K_09130 [Planctomycetia bacterium]